MNALSSRGRLLRNALVATLTIPLLGALVRALLSRFTTTLSVGQVEPTQGWPGTVIEVTGTGFSESRDDNQVQIGGIPALVMEASPTKLVALLGRGTTSGPVTVTVSGSTVTAARPFTVLAYPAPDDIGVDGPPVFVDGPMPGTPHTGVPDQPVLVAFAYPPDHQPDGGLPTRDDLRGLVEQAGTYWHQATYDATTWSFEYTDWFALPANRRTYFWEPGDIVDARRYLLDHTTAAIAQVGPVTLIGDSNGVLAYQYDNPDKFNTTVDLGGNATAIRVSGDRAYAVTGSSGLHVLDVSQPRHPVLLGSAPISGWCSGVDVSGTTAVVAARESGLLVFDVSNPANPKRIANVSVGHSVGDWAGAVRLVGSRALVANGPNLSVVDVSTPDAPVLGATVGVRSWVTALDVSGGICAVATDGDGLHVFDVTGQKPVERGIWTGAAHLRDVALDGSIAYVAGNESGLVCVDVSFPAAPAELGRAGTTDAAFAVLVVGKVALVAAGDLWLLGVDVTNPRAPVAGIPGVTVRFSYYPQPVGTWRAQLSTAIDNQGFVKDVDAFMIDALQAAKPVLPAGRSFNDYQGIIVIVNGPFLRGQSFPRGGFHSRGRDLQFNETKGALYVSPDLLTWGRIAHEIGHWFGMIDIYTERYEDGTVKTEGSAEDWCLGGQHDKGPLFCGYQIHEKIDVYGLKLGNVNVVDLPWSPTDPPMNQTFDVVAHDSTEDTDPDQVHLLRLRVSDGLWYYVEVRQAPVGLIFDQKLPLPAGASGVVLVTRVSEGRTFANEQERPVEVFGILSEGEEAVDAARGLVIRHEGVVQDRPHRCRVRVLWSQPVPDDPNGQFDMSITAWDPKTWDTPDIWVDSPRNNLGGLVIYTNSVPGHPDQPVLNGDRPWVGHRNKIYARIRNTGPAVVPDVYVTCYTTTPPGIGDSGIWVGTLGTHHIRDFPAHDPAVSGSGEQVIPFDWVPSVGEHTCLKIAIYPQVGEIQTKNNSAQENVFNFDSPGGSSHEPVVLDTEVRSPFTVRRKVDLVVQAVPRGWHVVVDHAWVWLEGKAAKPVRAVIWTDQGTPAGNRTEPPPTAQPRIEGWTWFDHRYIPIGGVLADVKANKTVETTPHVSVDGHLLIVYGCLVPPLSDVPITVEVTDRSGNSRLLHAVTDAAGCYNFANERVQLDSGEYRVVVFVTAGGAAAEMQTDPIPVTVR